MKLSERVKFARDFAIKAHGEQKYGVHPFSYHLDSVHAIIKQAGLDEDFEVAAYLHDIVEDTDVTLEEVKEKFGEHVGCLVWAVTGVGKDRKEKHENMKKKIASYPMSISLKMADRYVNMRSSKINRPKLYHTYAFVEHDSFYDLFMQGSPYIMEKIESILSENTNTEDGMIVTAPVFKVI